MQKEIFRIHPITPADKSAVAALRKEAEPNKGRLQGTAARALFDEIVSRVVEPARVSFHEEIVGGIPGWWCQPERSRQGEVIIHLHGGWFNWGSARAFRNLVGHIATSTGVDAFIPEYGLAPERTFPAAVHDVQACYEALVDRGHQRIALVGDSAGGCLALVLLALATAKVSVGAGAVAPVGAVALSPVTDLALTGESWDTRAVADPYFTRSQAQALINAYVGVADPTHPLISPLYGNLAGLPPVRVHVGNDEMLLDDSRRYIERAVAAGVDATLDVWEGMPHGFLSGIGNLNAAAGALDAISSFLTERLTHKP